MKRLTGMIRHFNVKLSSQDVRFLDLDCGNGLFKSVQVSRHGDTGCAVFTGNSDTRKEVPFNLSLSHANGCHSAQFLCGLADIASIESCNNSLLCSQGTRSVCCCDLAAGMTNNCRWSDLPRS